ncbi:hypothetical protein NMY22_g8455 [Coprinellus aureogranulatus]|nr:hypothetical protein NMY22_g8455 [Coprinellus aureogranulatus]
MSDLLQVGARCSLSSCNINDFLPITCKCGHTFCREHIFPDSHGCSAVSTSAASGAEAQEGNEKTKLCRCSVEGCSKPTMFAFTATPERETCNQCNKAFCVGHRYPDTHACAPHPNTTAPSTSQSAARALLEKNFGSNLAGSSTRAPKAKPTFGAKKPPSDPVKLAQYRKVQLMKMKHSAQPADPKDTPGSVPQGLRLVVGVSYDRQERAFWFREGISTGKAVDLLASQFQVKESKSMSLVKLNASGNVPLHNARPLAEEAADGDTLLLCVSSD